MTNKQLLLDYLLLPATQKLITQNLLEDTHLLALRLQGKHKNDVLLQIKLLQKASRKLPELYKAQAILSKRAYEQSSSEAVASYKAGLSAALSVLDICGGLGVDALAFSKNAQVVSLEPDEELHAIRNCNFKSLQADQIDNLNSTAEDYLERSACFGLIYFDPDRRMADERTDDWENYSPPFFETLEKIKPLGKEVWIKLSPLTDFQEIINRIEGIFEIHFIAERNEMKEILVRISSNKKEEINLISVNIKGELIEKFKRKYSDENDSASPDENTINYLCLLPVSLKVSRSISTYCEKENHYLFNAQSELIGSPADDFKIGQKFKVLFEGNKKELAFYLKSNNHKKAAIYTFNIKESQEDLERGFKLKHSNQFRLFVLGNKAGVRYFFGAKVKA